jgi:hypothetical protein
MKFIIATLGLIWAFDFVGYILFPNLLDGFPPVMATAARIGLFAPIFAFGAWIMYKWMSPAFK